MTRRMAWLALAGLLAAGAAGAAVNVQTGAKSARPYSQADLDYGRQLKEKLDATRKAAGPDSLKRAIEPFHIVGDTYYAGPHGHSVYAIKTREGVILIDNGWGDTTAKVEASLKALGIALTDIKILLITEGHGDHAGGTAYFKEKSGAKLYVMQGDVDLFEKRAAGPIKVDRILRDRDTVALGGKTLTAYHLPGHSAGSTTWYWQEREAGRTYNLAAVCCWMTPANVVSNPDFTPVRLRQNFTTLKSLPVDITLGTTTDQFDIDGKLARIKAGEARLAVFLDPQGYRGVTAFNETAFEEKLAKQIKDGPPPPPAPAGTAPPPAPAGRT